MAENRSTKRLFRGKTVFLGIIVELGVVVVLVFSGIIVSWLVTW